MEWADKDWAERDRLDEADEYVEELASLYESDAREQVMKELLSETDDGAVLRDDVFCNVTDGLDPLRVVALLSSWEVGKAMRLAMQIMESAEVEHAIQREVETRAMTMAEQQIADLKEERARANYYDYGRHYGGRFA